MFALSSASASSCSASTLTSGGCGKATKIGVVVGGIKEPYILVAYFFHYIYNHMLQICFIRESLLICHLLLNACFFMSLFPFADTKCIEKRTTEISYLY